MMKRRWFAGAAAAAMSVLALASPAVAHGDHDARPLARGIEAGPYIVSLWQVYPDAGAAMTPHLIVMIDGNVAAEGAPGIAVHVNARPVDVRPSTTTADGWETITGLFEGDVVTVTVSHGDQSWELESVVVPPPATSMIPMPELIYTSIFLTAGTALWAAKRTGRAWRRPAIAPS